MADDEKYGKGQTVQIGTQLYYMEITFFNGMPSFDVENPTKFKDEIYIPFNLVDELVIKESLSQWWTTGHIILQNDFQFLEKGSTYKSNTGEKKKLKNVIVDRPDGRNKFFIRLYPINNLRENDTNFKDIGREEYEICYDFVVYDIQDMPSPNAEKKYKKYLFWEERYQLFLERNLEFSTANIVRDLFGFQDTFASDLERAVSPNIALKELIKKASLYPDGSEIKIGYSDEGSIKEPDIFIGEIKDDEWDIGPSGDTQQDKIFYTSKANDSVIDDINYILPLCQSYDGFPVILQYGRRTDDKRFKLVSLKKIFDDAIINQKERLILFDTKDAKTGALNNAQWVPRGPDISSDGSVLINFTSGYASKVTSYYFCPMVNMDDLNFCTQPFQNFNVSTGSFNIKFDDNKIEDVYTKAMDEMCKGLSNLQPPNNGQLLLKINKIKLEAGMLKNIFSPLPMVSHKIPMLQMLKDLVFLNQSLVFEAYGLTFRRPGIFFTLECLHSGPDQNDFWDKFLGQWMITDIDHIFRHTEYKNVVNAVKLDSKSTIYNNTDYEYIA